MTFIVRLKYSDGALYTRSDAKDKGNEYSNLWVTKTFITCAEPLPSLRRRVEVLMAPARLVPVHPAITAASCLQYVFGRWSSV